MYAGRLATLHAYTAGNDASLLVRGLGITNRCNQETGCMYAFLIKIECEICPLLVSTI
jgi:hypothetical protein